MRLDTSHRGETWLAFLLVAGLLAAVTCVTWMTPDAGPVRWAFRIGSPLAIVACAWGSLKLTRRPPETLPDLLAEVEPRYFEREGLCFAARPRLADGACRIEVYFQNRYAGHCTGRIVILPPMRTFSFGRHKFPPIDLSIECPGGAFGVARVPFPYPPKYNGRRMKFDVAAAAGYRPGRGPALRFRTGVRVDKPARRDDLLLAVPMFGLLDLATRSRLALTLPPDAAPPPPEPSPTPTVEILWSPGSPQTPPAMPRAA